MKLKEFSKKFDVRFTDLNAGNHLSNHMVLGYITDYLSEFLMKNNCSYTDVYGQRVLFSRMDIELKREVFQFDCVVIRVDRSEIKSRKLALHFIAEVNNKVVAKSTHHLNFLKDNKVVSISDELATLFAF